MKTRTALTGVFAAVVVTIVGWQFGAAAITPHPTSTSTPGSGSALKRATAAGATLTDGTYTGSVVQTRYGTVQVQVTVAGGALTEVTALALPSDEGRSVQIGNEAAPILRSEVLASQSADVASVSGATFTSEGYLTSLQAALDKAA